MIRRRFQSSSIALSLVTTTAAFAFTAHAKSVVYDDEEPGVPTVAAPPTASTSLAGMFGLPSISAALKSPDAATRVAAVERAAEVAQNATEDPARDAAWALVEGATNATLDDDPEGSLAVRLAAVRALSKSPREGAVKALSPMLRNPEPPIKSTYTTPYNPYGGPYGGPYPPYPPYPAPYPYSPYGPPIPPVQHKAGKRASADLVRYVRETSAMALAARRDHAELLARLRAKGDDPSHETERAVLLALAAYPAPQSPLDALQGKGEKMKLDAEDALLLDRIGDVRAADILYAGAQGDGALAATSLRALAHLGDTRVLSLANGVAQTASIALRIAAAETLGILGDPGAEAAILKVLEDPKAPADAKRLAIEYPSAGLVPTLAPLAAQGDAKAIAALGRIGAPATGKLLEIARDDASPGRDAAAYALAVMPGADLSAISPGSAARKRRAVRAGAVRAARVGSVPSSIKGDAKSLAESSVAEDRAAGTLLLAILDIDRARDALKAKDLATKKAGATALLAHPREKSAEIARAHLASDGVSEDPDVVRALAGVAARAVDGSVAHDVPISNAILAGWLSEDSAASPVAAFLLAARGGSAVHAHVARALTSSSYGVRAGALLGLGLSPDPGAASTLVREASSIARSYLRRAAFRALAARGTSTALTALRRLEPDPEARAIAASAKSPRSPLLAGSEVVEVRVDGAPAPLASATTADGLAYPVLVDPEGFVFLFRAPAGASEVSAEPKGKGS